jgi:hypothetical protein
MKSPAFFDMRSNGGVNQKSSRDGSDLRRFRIEAPSAASSSSSISFDRRPYPLPHHRLIASGLNPGGSSLTPTLLSFPRRPSLPSYSPPRLGLSCYTLFRP